MISMDKSKSFHTFIVLTPTYQRVSTLPRLYESLCKQTFRDFKWLIIDDGSNDGTEELIRFYIDEKKIDIEYHWKANGGKHTAFQEALKYINSANCKYVAPADSDDTMTEKALEIFNTNWEDIKKKGKNIGYIKSRCILSSTGRQFPYKTPNDNSLDTSYLYVTYILGDFCEYESCAKVDVFRKYSIAPKNFWLSNRYHFNYFPEGTLWARAGKDLIFRYIPDVTRIYYDDAANSLVHNKDKNYNRLYPRLISPKYLLSENFSLLFRYQKKFLIKKMVLFTVLWYILDVKWTECYKELEHPLLRIIFMWFTPFAPIMKMVIKDRL